MDVLLIGILTIAVLADLKSYKIPNALTYTSLVGLLIILLSTKGPPGLLQAIISVFIAWGILFLIYLVRGLGAGDVKLFMVIAAALGTKTFFLILIASLIISAIYGLFKITFLLILRKKHGTCHIHFSLPILAATCMYYARII
jgi:prepilin peptidase CpaA